MNHIAAVIPVIASLLFFSCGHRGEKGTVPEETDSLTVSEKPLERFPDTVYASVNQIKWDVTVLDTTVDGRLQYLTDPYDLVDGTYTFRGNQRREMPVSGKVSGTPSEIIKVWEFMTDCDLTETSMGTWGGGSGWTGQPVYVHWSDSLMDRFRASSPGLTDDFSEKEIIVGSLSRHVYFIDYETGKASRTSINSGNTIKGSVTLDPEYANVYVGHGIPITEPFGTVTIDLFQHKVTHAFGRDSKPWRSWQAYDACAIVAGGFLFRTGENGGVYKFARSQGSLSVVSRLRFREARRGDAAGIESSMAVCRNYGYFGDNRGNILCINLDTMNPVWYYDNHDDTDGSIVIEEKEGVPYVYTCSEMEKQGENGKAYFVKLNGLTGEKVWETTFPCKIGHIAGKHFDGGMYATPLLGHGDCEDLIFTHICDNIPAFHGFTVALRKDTGEPVWTHDLIRYAWSSPAAFYNEEGKLFLFAGDCYGNVYLLDGRTGERLFTTKIGDNFESSPVVMDDCVVMGSRGMFIYKMKVQ